jgi:hypothetical protein
MTRPGPGREALWDEVERELSTSLSGQNFYEIHHQWALILCSVYAGVARFPLVDSDQ